MNALKVRHLENILYNEDELKERTRLLFGWVKSENLTQDEFDVLVARCNDEKVKLDKIRRYGF